MKNEEQIEAWIHARIDGELGPAEAALLERALAEDAELARLARALEGVERAAGELRAEAAPDPSDAAAIERILAGVEAQIEVERPVLEGAAMGNGAPVLMFSGRGRLAAAALVLVGVGAWVWSSRPPADVQPGTHAPAVAKVARGGAGLLAADNPVNGRAEPGLPQGAVPHGAAPQVALIEDRGAVAGPGDPRGKDPLAVGEPEEAEEQDPLALLAAAGAGALDEAAVTAVLDELDALGLGGYRTVELAKDMFTGARPASPQALSAAAALLAFDGGPGALRALERGLDNEAAAASCAAALVFSGSRGAQRLHRRLDDERLGRTAALALAGGGADDLELLLERLAEQPDDELLAAIAGADPEVLNRVLDRSEPTAALLELAVTARPLGALALLVRAARERETAPVALAHLVHWGEPAGLRAVLELLEYGQVDRAVVEQELARAEFDPVALLPLAQQLGSGSDRRWRAALLSLLIENPIRGSEPTLLALSAADDLPQDQRLLGALLCATIEGPLDETSRAALKAFVLQCDRDDARLAACAVVALARRAGLAHALDAFAWTRSTDRLQAAIAPFSLDAPNPIDVGPPRAFTSSDVSRVARTLEPHLPLQDPSNI